MIIRGSGPNYPPKGFELPARPVSEDDPWASYLDVLEIQGRPPLVQNEFRMAFSRLTERQQATELAAAQWAASHPPDPLPDTMKDWQRACWGRPSWHRHHWGGWGGGYREPWSGRYNSGHRC